MTADDHTPRSGETIADEQPTDYEASAGARTIPTRSAPAEVFVDAGDDGEASLRVRGCWLDDEPGDVTITTTLGHAEVSIYLDPSGARAFAEKIAEAARFAEEGE